MRILYGVQGTGNGHITRARAMAYEMHQLGIDVDFVFSGRTVEDYFDMAIFGHYQTFEGLSFVARNGELDLHATYKKARLGQFYRDVQRLDTRGYDLVMTDYEPIVAWAAKRQGVPCLGFGHQYAFTHDIPRYQKNRLAQWVMSNFAPVSSQLGAHWHHFGHPILPPLVSMPETQSTVSADHVLVYLPFENSEAVFEWLEAVPNYHFRVHCKDIDPGIYGNIEVFPFDRTTFQKNLSECQSVLCNAGFELNSEALQLGRRILTKPLKGQIEQHSNVMALSLLGLTSTCDALDEKVIANWLETREVAQIRYPNVAKAVVEWLVSGHDERLDDLCESLWSQVSSDQPIDFSYTKTSKVSDQQRIKPLRIRTKKSAAM
ncbi:MJ1255/VC2487 family glycosyltransferase [Marinomonas algarum]|uniref:Glycosyltransferase n=1 Tax=Marinomonas algarum TaxID=2883105 RepID=A0A9X1IKF2_9GAMM|nr:MJ1255/VC2487 family glycosyltransferase [Marinomonas algarum]MCB5160835.1 glycosyltransferase [Marinomonas algarum]